MRSTSYSNKEELTQLTWCKENTQVPGRLRVVIITQGRLSRIVNVGSDLKKRRKLKTTKL